MAEPHETRRAGPEPLQELRRLTVLFCDIVGSTEIGAKLDIEDYCALIDGFKELCQQRIETAGGWLAQFQGDGVLAYFGYPASFEDPARRAVRAGLTIVDELKSRKFRLPSQAESQLSVRVSVHTGSVVTLRDSEPSSQLPEGVSINIAKKIQQFAPINGVVISAETEVLIRYYFNLKGPKTVSLDQVENSLPIYEVTGERAKTRLAEHSFDRNLPPMVNRLGELQLVDERWGLARQGLGQCVLLLGEAGIGKSRLIHEFKRRNAIGNETWFEVRCTPDTVDSAFFPFREFLASRLSGPSSTDSKSLRQQVARHLKTLRLLSDSNEQALLLLLGAPPKAPASEPALPAVIGKRIKEFLVNYFLACSESGALVLLVEDLHSSDASTREIIQSLALRSRNSSVLIVCVQRPERAHPFSGRADITSLVLNPLPPLHLKELVDNLTPDREISELRAEQLFHLTGGNPLFVEQYIASSGQHSNDNAETLTTPRGSEIGAPAGQIPPTLQELIAYRLEQLGEAKSVAQCASVLGQYIRPDILQRVLDIDVAEFDRMIESLLHSNILVYTAETPRQELRFQHALIREAAYETLLGSTRREFHRRIAEQLVQEQPNNDLIPHEVIARHFALAQAPRQSIAHWERAAAQASSRFANAEALSHLREAVTQVNLLPASEAEPLEIEIREALTVPLEAMRGWAAEETEGNLKRLLELQASRSDEVGVFSVYHGLSAMHGIRGEVTKALGYVEKMQMIADRTDDVALRVLSLRVSGILHFLIADFPTSLRMFEEMAGIYTDEVREGVSAHYPANPVAVGYAFSALALAIMGDEQKSLEVLAKAHDAISSGQDEFTRAYVEGFASSVSLALGRYDAAIASASACLALAKKNSFDYWISWAKITLGYGRLVKRPGDRDALALMEGGLNGYKSTGSRQILPYGLGLLADALIRSGHDQRALTVIKELEHERRDNEVFFFDEFNNKLTEWRNNRTS